MKKIEAARELHAIYNTYEVRKVKLATILRKMYKWGIIGDYVDMHMTILFSLNFLLYIKSEEIMKIKTNRYFFKKAEKGWTIMKRRTDGYIIAIHWVASWQEARQQVYKLNGWS